jgi:restriction system protein
MAIPDYQTIMLPLLKFAADEKEHSLREAIDTLSDQFNLTNQERRELLPSKNQAIFDNRVGWARTYLKKAGLLSSTRRGYMIITPRGLGVLKENPRSIDVSFLFKFKEFREFKAFRRDRVKKSQSNIQQSNIKKYIETEESKGITPEEILGTVFQDISTTLANDLLQQIKANPPTLFENIVIDLLLKMGYGGSRKDAGEAIGKTGDEGIDGIIKEDTLGLDIIYIQAKRWDNTVSRPEIQKFAGALQGKRARKGIFITTSNFSREATEFVSNIDTKISLIDGEQLAQLMIEHNIGVSPSATYETKKIDMDYFTGD